MDVQFLEVTNTMEDHYSWLLDANMLDTSTFIHMEKDTEPVNFMTTPCLVVNGNSVVSLTVYFFLLNNKSKGTTKNGL